MPSISSTSVDNNIRRNGIDPNDLKGLSDNFAIDLGRNIEEARWNRFYPYQLVVLDAHDTSGAQQYTLRNGWQFTLPISPEQLSISQPFAMTAQVTQGGIVEQNNGSPIRTISFSGSTGLLPFRNQGDGLPDSLSGQIVNLLSNTAQSIFAGTIQAATNARNAAVSAVFQGAPFTGPNLYVDALTEDGVDSSTIPLRGTGYYQFRILGRFLESYAAMKRTEAGKNMRLALLIWKDQAAYLVTPTQYEVRRSADSPHEYKFSLQLRAWRRICSDDIGTIAWARVGRTISTRDPNLIDQILGRVRAAREALSGLRKTIQAISPDYDQSVGEILRETALFLKESKGVGPTLSELSNSVVKSLKPALQSAADSLTGLKNSRDPKVQAGLNDLKTSATNKKLGNTTQDPDPAAKIFKDPADSYALMDLVPASSLAISAPIRKQINDEKARIANLNRYDFEVRRDTVQKFAATYAAKVGLSDPTYEATYGITGVAQIRPPTDADHKVLQNLSDTVTQLSRLAAYSLDTTTLQGIEGALQAVAGLAGKSGIDFKVPVGKKAVPVPYGSTVEQIALRYLGDASRWGEITTLNGLVAPYIDEVGVDQPLLTNGQDNSIVVSDASGLYLGQPVQVWSATKASTSRRIVAINEVAPNYWSVQLDGNSNLSDYKVVDSAQLHSYLPGTTNSQHLIYIPTTTKPRQDDRTRAVPGVSNFEQYLEVGGIDLLLTSSGDLAATLDGDVKLAIGLTNLVQYTKIALTTPKGTLLMHPEFGLDAQIGKSMADFSAKDLLDSAKTMFGSDQSFVGVLAASIQKNAPAVQMNLAIGVAGTDDILPITIDLA